MAKNKLNLRNLYRTLDVPGDNPLKQKHAELDKSVRSAYGMKAKEDPLAFLLSLNQKLAEREAEGQEIVAPGLPPCVKDAKPFITKDCLTA